MTELKLENMDVVPGSRFARDDNKFGFSGIDHVALPALNVDRMAKFIRDVLGGEFHYIAGYSEEDRQLGRAKHAFMRVGATLIQFAAPADGEQKVGKTDMNSWPHWALGVTADGLRDNVERLRSLGIPVYGPVQHRGSDGVSAYFTSPEGHKLELVTREAEAEQYSIGYTGTPKVGHIPWADLFHDWSGD